MSRKPKSVKGANSVVPHRRPSGEKPINGMVYVTFNGEFSSAAANFISRELGLAPEAGRSFVRGFRDTSIIYVPQPTLEIAETRASIWQEASDRIGVGFRFGWN